MFDPVMHIEGLHPTTDVLVQAGEKASRLDSLADFRRDADGSDCFDAAWGIIRVHRSHIHVALEDVPRSSA